MITMMCGRTCGAGAGGAGSPEDAGVLVRGTGRACGATARVGVVGDPGGAEVVGGIGGGDVVVGIVLTGLSVDAVDVGAGSCDATLVGASFPPVETATRSAVTMAIRFKIARL